MVTEMTGEDPTPTKNTTRFEKGVSGNPNGRPKSARNKSTLAAEALLDGEAGALTRKAIELALNGDLGAIRLCLERIIPDEHCMAEARSRWLVAVSEFWGLSVECLEPFGEVVGVEEGFQVGTEIVVRLVVVSLDGGFL